jgi:predicted phosphodiesterase
MNILHITDFHYSAESQTKIIDSIINCIRDKKIKIDLVFFTGDLVNKGNKIENFNNASRILFDPFYEQLNISKENIIFCAGNHDINRAQVHGAMKSFFDTTLNSSISLNEFYSRKDDVFYDSLKPSENFNSFLKEFHSDNKNDKIRDLYSIHIRNVNGKKLGIVCMNSAWISSIDKTPTAKDDKGNLLIPLNLLKEVKEEFGEVDKKMILLHHPLYFLKDFNLYEIENFIHNDFDLLFSGHVHKISSVSRHSGSNGIFEHVAKASLTNKENLGCSLIELDEVQENIIRVTELTYIPDNDNCHVGSPIIHTIPCGPEKAELISFRKKIFDKILIEKENADKLLLLDDEENKDFLTLYNHPILKKEFEGGLETKNAPSISLEELVSCENNYIILGKDKCGKTSILKRIQLECLINYSRNRKIPYFFDAKEQEAKLDDKFELEQIIRSYFETNKAKVQDILESEDFLLLIDNYSPKSGMAVYLDDFLGHYQKVTYLICTEYNLSRTVDVFELGQSIYNKIYFHDLKRQQIIAYTDNRLSSHKKKVEIQDKIIQLCKQLELPLNYWTVSLLLLIHSKSTDSYSKNLFSILDICIEEIFGKKQLLLSHSRLSFEQLKKICADLAKELFTNHGNTTYSACYEDILKQISITIEANNRISANSKEVIDYLLSTGILKQKNENDYYVFRLNGFFEYFLALQMTRDNSFKKEILSDEVKYLAFKNQIEIYSGFKRDDLDFLNTVYQNSLRKLGPIFKGYKTDKDKELLSKIQEPRILEDYCRDLSIRKALSSSQKAILEDMTDELQVDADVHQIKLLNPLEINSELIERYLSILARTFRNMDEITGNKDKTFKFFNSLINWYCDLGFYIIDEYKAITKQEILKDSSVNIEDIPELGLLKFISNFSPLISQTWLFDGMGHYNIERMVKKEIAQLEENSYKNQYRLFMLYFLLLDIDLNSNKEYIKNAMDNLKIPILKYTITIKLNYYLAFKTTNNKALEQELSRLIQKAKLNIDSKVSTMGDIQKQIQEKKKIALINKNQSS